jgi:hypothetical protein
MIHTRVIDTQRLSTLANAYEGEMLRYLRNHDGPVVKRIRQEMERVEFDEIRVDPTGTILGRIGSGKSVIVVEPDTDRGGAAMASLAYAGKIIHELGLYGDYTLWVVGPGRSEAAKGLRPDCVLVAEPTGLRIYRPLTMRESHPLVRSAIATYETLFELPPVIGRWPGTKTAGVPTVGFGPGEEDASAHVPIRHLVIAAQFYAAFPQMYVDTVTRH